MNILFIGRRSRQESVGVLAKLEGQMRAFRQLGHAVYATDMDEKSCWLETPQGERVELWKYRRYFPAALAPSRNHARLVQRAAEFADVNFDMAYIRKPLYDAAYLRALDTLKKRGAVTVEEIPSYPYDAERAAEGTMAARMYLRIDRSNRSALHRHLDYIATYARRKQIFGVPVIQLENAVEVKALPLHQKRQADDGLQVIAVAAMQQRHGYDRLLRGLANYYSNGQRLGPVVLHLVGDGPERSALEALAAELKLEGQAVFYGTQQGEALDAIFAQCDIAASSFGWHRIGFKQIFEIKAREYVARGFPYMYAVPDPLPEAIRPYCLKVPEDESPVDFEAVAGWWASIRNDDYPHTLRAYAEKNLNWERQMAKVLQAVEEKRAGR